MRLALVAAVVSDFTAVPTASAQADVVTGVNGNASVNADQSAGKGFDADPHVPLSPAEAKGEAEKFARAEGLAAAGVLQKAFSKTDITGTAWSG